MFGCLSGQCVFPVMQDNFLVRQESRERGRAVTVQQENAVYRQADAGACQTRPFVGLSCLRWYGCAGRTGKTAAAGPAWRRNRRRRRRTACCQQASAALVCCICAWPPVHHEVVMLCFFNRAYSRDWERPDVLTALRTQLPLSAMRRRRYPDSACCSTASR